MAQPSELFERFRENVLEHERITHAVATSTIFIDEASARSMMALSESRELLTRLEKQITQW
jgi:hypothetical protein